MHILKYNHIKPGVDLVADRHGYFAEEVALLSKMDYTLVDGVFKHLTGERTIQFLGDAPDRGDRIVDVNTVEEKTIREGFAKGIMGNHEYNLWAMDILHPHKEKEYLRARNDKNKGQTKHTHKQYKALGDDKALWQAHLKYYQDLPIYGQNAEFRVAHACWDPKNIAILDKRLKDGKLTQADVIEAELAWRETPFSVAVLETLKGKEFDTDRLSEVGFSAEEIAGLPSTKRIAWWYENRGDIEVPIGDVILDLPKPMRDRKIPLSFVADQLVDDPDPRPIFFGHYSLGVPPRLTSAKAQCLDFSVIKSKGCLTAYRWNFGDTGLSEDRLVSVPRTTSALIYAN